MTINRIDFGDSLQNYHHWKSPVTIISDGAYGINGFSGDPRTVKQLPEWYEPHLEMWSEAATSSTSLWFWNTEEGWATMHPKLIEHGWEYVQLITWDKGISHAAGNVNSNTIRRFPVVTEVSALYTRPIVFHKNKQSETMQDWLRSEWQRTGLPFSEANKACDVKNAASRKWLTSDAMWYLPPYEMFLKLKQYADLHGNPANGPYFNAPDKSIIEDSSWDKLRTVWNHVHGLTNVWSVPALRSTERIKNSDGKNFHTNQKPLILMERQITATSKPGDIIWEPFGGMCSASTAAKKLGRNSYAAEINPEYYSIATQRVAKQKPESQQIAT